MTEKNQTQVKADGERVYFPMDLTFARKDVGELLPGIARVEFLDEAKDLRVRVVIKDGRTKTITLTAADIVKAALPEIRVRGKIANLKAKNPEYFKAYEGKGKGADTGEDW